MKIVIQFWVLSVLLEPNFQNKNQAFTDYRMQELTIHSHYPINTCLIHSCVCTCTDTNHKVNISNMHSNPPPFMKLQARGTSMQCTYLLVWEAAQATAAESIKRQLFLSRLMPDCVQVRLIALDAVLCTLLQAQHTTLPEQNTYLPSKGQKQAYSRRGSSFLSFLPWTLISSLRLLDGLWCLNEAKVESHYVTLKEGVISQGR